MGPVRNPDGGHEAKGEGNEFHDREKLVEPPPTLGKPAFPIMIFHRKSRAVPAEKKRRPPLTNAETAAGPLPERLPYAAIRAILEAARFRNDTLV
jgi:hypothetical protein